MLLSAKSLAALLLFSLGLVSAEPATFVSVEEPVLRARLAAIEKSNPDRFAKLKRMFEDAGCRGDRLTTEDVKGSKLPNLICTLKGESDDVVLVTAHFDQVGVAQGAVDNWSGASLLPSLYQSVSAQTRHLTFRFVGFTDEERGMRGSQAMVRKLGPEGLSHIRAMINIDSVGLTPAKIWAKRADKALLDRLAVLASAMKLSLSAMNVDGVGDTDSHYFAEKKVPVLDFHSVTPETWRVLHSSKDVSSAIVFEHYRDTYQLIAGFLAYSDSFLSNTAKPSGEAGN